LILNLLFDIGSAFAVSKNFIRILFGLANVTFAILREIDADEFDISVDKKNLIVVKN
jgi:hypothetical protein